MRRAAWTLIGLLVMGTALADSEKLKAELEQGVLGLKWGAPFAEVLDAYPKAHQLPKVAQVAVRAPSGLWNVRAALGDVFILTVDPEDGFTAVDFHIAESDVRPLLRTLETQIGPGRSTSLKSWFGTFSHAYEWTAAEYGVTLTFATKKGGPQAPAVRTGAVHVQRGPLSESAVDTLEKSRIQLPDTLRRETEGPKHD